MAGPTRRARAIVLVASVLAAGCLAPGADDERGRSSDELAEALDLAAADCDRPPLDERVRAREFDIATDPSDPSHLVATMMVPWPSQYALAPYDSMAWTGLAQSEDGGRTWTYAPLSGYPGDPDVASSPFAGAIVAGDPIVQFAPDGSFYLAVILGYPPLTLVLKVARFEWGVFEPTTVATLSNGALGPGFEDVPTTQPLMHNDKEQLLVDPATGHLLVTWSYRLQATSRAVIVASSSTDEGRTWSEPVPLSPMGPHYLVADEHQMGPWPLLLDDGRVLVLWTDMAAGVLYASESPDGGATWLERRAVREQPGIWLVAAATDASGGPDHGSVYVVATDERDDAPHASLTISRDGGRTWTEERRVTDDPGRDRMPDIVVDPEGAVSVLTMSEVDGPEDVHAFVSHSTDGGRSFTVERVTREATSPTAINNQPSFLTHLGDYVGITYNERGVVALWQDGRESTADVPYSEGWVCELPTRT